METRYYARLKDPVTGDTISEISNYLSLSLDHRVNSSGFAQITLDGDDTAVQFFGRDTIVEVYRSVQDFGLDWYLEFEGLSRTPVRQTFENGRRSFTANMQGYVDLLSRRIIAYNSGTSYVEKNAVAETVMKQFVNENIGPGATAPPRISAGVCTGFLVEPDAAQGSVWSGARAYKNLLEVLQEISDETNVFFDVIGFQDNGFVFRVYPGVRNLDRRYIAINAATGLNSAGNAPAVFSLDRGNVKAAVRSENATNQVTRVFALGQGVEDARRVVVVEDAAASAESPWNLHEIARNASSEDDDAGLTKVGNAELNAGAPVNTFNFEVLQTEGSFYGRHYTWGDYVTGRYDAYIADKYIIGASISVNVDQGESVSLTLADIP